MAGEAMSLRSSSPLYSDALHTSGTSGLTDRAVSLLCPMTWSSFPLHSAPPNPGEPAGGDVAALPSSPGSASIRDTRVWLGQAGLPWNQRFLPLEVCPWLHCLVFAALIGVERTGGSGDPCGSGSRASCFFSKKPTQMALVCEA